MTTDILPLSPTPLPKVLTQTAVSTATAPSTRQISDFAQLMAAAKKQQHVSEVEALQKMPISPIQPGAMSERTALLSALQAQGQEIKKRFRMDAVNEAQEIGAALKMQGDVAMGLLKLELLTKVTNGLAQGINKLTSMA